MVNLVLWYHNRQATRSKKKNQEALTLNTWKSGQGRKKPRSNCPGQVKIEIWWPNAQVKLAFLVLWICLSFSLMNDNNFQTNYFQLNTARWVTQLVESMNQVHICSLMLLLWSPLVKSSSYPVSGRVFKYK